MRSIFFFVKTYSIKCCMEIQKITYFPIYYSLVNKKITFAIPQNFHALYNAQFFQKFLNFAKTLRFFLIKHEFIYRVEDIYCNLILFTSQMKNVSYLVLYSASFLILGQLLTALGPLIPYMAEDQGKQETEFSFLFVTRSIGSIVGAILYKILHEKKLLPSHHKVLCFSSVCVFISNYFFTKWQYSTLGLGISSAVGSVMGYLVNMAVNCCLMLASNKETLNIWLSISHGMFGVGGLTSPLLVNIFKLNTYFVLGALSLITAPFFLYLTSPQDLNKEEAQGKQVAAVQQVTNGSLKLEILMSIGFFLISGNEVNVGGWISSYATMSGISDKEGAALFATIFWGFFTLFRFVLPLIKVNDSTKIKRCLDLCLLTLAASIVLALLQQRAVALYICAALLGIGFSQAFPLLLSMCGEYDIKFSQAQFVNMMTAVVLSQGTLASATGFLMDKFTIEMFFYSILFMTLVLRIDVAFIISDMEGQFQYAKQKELGTAAVDEPVD